MATERNPYETISEEVSNVIPMPEVEDTSNATFEVDPTDGGVIVDFSEENVEMEASEDIAEWYGDLAETLEEDDLVDIASDVIENFEADKDSRADWESMFERGFDLLGLKLEPGSEPFDGACTAVHAPSKGSDPGSSFKPNRSKPLSNIDSHSPLESLSA